MYPYSSTRFSLSMVENEQTNAGQDSRACLAKLYSQARTRTGKYSCFTVQLTMSIIGNHTRLIHIMLKALTIHTHIHVHTCVSRIVMEGL